MKNRWNKRRKKAKPIDYIIEKSLWFQLSSFNL